jgi:hypothetical protein
METKLIFELLLKININLTYNEVSIINTYQIKNVDFPFNTINNLNCYF